MLHVWYFANGLGLYVRLGRNDGILFCDTLGTILFDVVG